MSEADDLRQFLREMLARFDRSMSVIDRRLDVQTEAVLAQTRTMERNTADIRDEMRAQREALFLILDHIRGAQGGA